MPNHPWPYRLDTDHEAKGGCYGAALMILFWVGFCVGFVIGAVLTLVFGVTL